MDKLPPLTIDSENFLNDHANLPPLPDVLHQIQQLINDPDTSVGDIAAVLEKDPAIVAETLKIVNSAYYGLPREVLEIKFAVAYIGIREVYHIVLSLSVVNSLNIKEKKLLKNFWAHSWLTALFAKHLAKQFDPLLEFDKLWSGAILHDIGKLVYFKFFPEHFTALQQYSRENGCLFSQAEKALDMPASAELGGILCRQWRLPDVIRQACQYHDPDYLTPDYPSGATEPYIRIICLANLAAILSSGQLSETVKQTLAQTIQTTLNCSEDDFLKLMGDFYTIKEEAKNYL